MKLDQIYCWCYFFNVAAFSSYSLENLLETFNWLNTIRVLIATKWIITIVRTVLIYRKKK